MRNFDIKGNGDEKVKYDNKGRAINPSGPIKNPGTMLKEVVVEADRPKARFREEIKSISPSKERMGKMVGSLKKPLVIDTEGKGYRHIKTDLKTGKTDTTYTQPKQITRMQFDMDDENYMYQQKTRQFNEYARKTGLIPEFKDSVDASGTAHTSPEMIKFYSDKSKMKKLNQQQKEYFKKNKWDMVERDIEGNRTKKYPSYKGPIK